MKGPSETPIRNISVVRAAPEQEPILANLLELYIHDFSEFQPIEIGPDGRFGYKNLSNYWSLPDHHPFLITFEDRLAGFALVRRARALSNEPLAGDSQVWDMAEFFVVRAHRRHGVGLAAAQQLWHRFPAPWQVRVMRSNLVALQFWQRAIDIFTGHLLDPVSIERDGKSWAVFTFENRNAGND